MGNVAISIPRRRRLIATSVALALIVIAAVGIVLAINRAVDRVIDSRSGPVHHFPIPAGETFLTDDRAAAIGREVMNRDGFAESDWELMTDDRSKAPDGRRDPSTTFRTGGAHQVSVRFHCPTSPTPIRYVNVEWREDEITARGVFGK